MSTPANILMGAVQPAPTAQPAPVTVTAPAPVTTPAPSPVAQQLDQPQSFAPIVSQPAPAAPVATAQPSPATAPSPAMQPGPIPAPRTARSAAVISLLGAVSNVFGQMASGAAAGSRGNSGIAGAGLALEQQQQQNAAAQAAAAKQNQQNFDNQVKLANLSTEQKKADAAQANATVDQYLHVAMSRDYDAAYRQKTLASSKLAMSSMQKAGAPTLLTGQDSNAMQDRIAKDAATGHRDNFYIDNYIPVTDAAGKPAIDEMGNPKMQPTFTVMGQPPVATNHTVTPEESRYLTENHVTDLPAGSTVNPQSLYQMMTMAQKNAGVTENIKKTQAETAKLLSDKQKTQMDEDQKKLTFDQKAQASKIFAKYLGGPAKGNAAIAFQNLQNSPDAKYAPLILSVYGSSVIQKSKDQQIQKNNKQISVAQQILNDAKSAPDEKQAAQQQLQTATQNNNQLLGLHKNDPPQFTAAVQALDKIDPAQRAQYITSSTIPEAAKNYLRKHYNIPIPQQPAQPVTR